MQHASTPPTVTLGDVVVATSLSATDLLAWMNAGVLPPLEQGLDGPPTWPAGVVDLVNQIDAFLELELQLDDVRDLLHTAGLSPWRP
jgi:hypothetical protein